MIFLPVGTQFGFDRLVRAVDKAIEDGIITDSVFAQIGPGSFLPKRMEYVISLEKEAFDETLRSCHSIISHAGMGNISLAIKSGKPLLVMPRLKKYGEVVNNHQEDTARKFEGLGHILVAYDTSQLPEKIQQLKTFIPKTRVPNRQGVIDCIREFMKSAENND
jgi:UDP-N-acetylglucosamine transferase subunit ALG13